MLIVSQITDDPKQTHTLQLPDGTSLDLALEYKPQQFSWFITKLVYKSKTIENMRICTSPNILHQFKNQLPFGIGIAVPNQDEPTQLEDFLSGRATFYILTAAEVKLYGEVLSGKVPA